MDGSRVSCSDSGPGSETAPFCSVQRAVDLAGPGQTVSVAAGTYRESVRVTRSGTAEAPITIRLKDEGELDVRYRPYFGVDGLTVSGVSHVVIRGVSASGGNAVVSDAHNVTLERSAFDTPDSGTALRITDGSSRVVLARDTIAARVFAAGLVVEQGSTETVLTTSVLSTSVIGRTSPPVPPLVAVNGAPGTVITGNTLHADCGIVIGLDAGSTGSSVRNNVIATVMKGSTCGGSQGVRVSADSTERTVSDYNLFDVGEGSPYIWAGTAYASLDTFRTATGQGSHDLTGSATTSYDECRQHDVPDAGSGTVDSADAAVPGQLALDFYGRERSDDPAVPNRGTGVGYHDRGAVERTDCMKLHVNGTWKGSRAVALDGQLLHSWTGPTTVTVDWGDGSSAQLPVGQSPFTLVLDHSYVRLGTYQVTVTALSSTASASTTVTAYTSGNGYTPVPPTRVLDTRTDPDPDAGGRTGPIPARATRAVKVPDSIPADVTALVLNVTAVNPKEPGFLTVYRWALPETSSLNFEAGEVVANLVTVDTRSALIYNGSAGTTDVVVDIAGYYRQSGSPGYGYTPLSPVRLLDTRPESPTGTARTVPANGQLTIAVAGTAGLPAQGVEAVTLNVTAVNAKASGHVTVHPGGTPRPNASNLNFASGRIVPNAVIVKTGGDGTVTLYNGSSAPVDLLVDLQGYYTASGGLAFVPTLPKRLTDTRETGGGGSISPLTTRPVDVHDLGIMHEGWFPARAVVLNTTVVTPTAPGYLTVFPDDTGRPTASNLNFTAGRTVANLTTSKISADGHVSFFNGSGGYTHLLVDRVGFFY
ncbi:hypothetical protein F4556_001848 [Kitasatospora gansuensis]|uniref:PKD domain-containing protein n=2 Tax=Kitasatospora TaxID=2063 RepID=A0A7W7SAI8_9ACTN|nr:right-handed parallel beta-helix repeat-containing protein [Kitasatospora gansuensis]MBB4946313.1 hypothetical protein [Kitasatospora gansuensis]